MNLEISVPERAALLRGRTRAVEKLLSTAGASADELLPRLRDYRDQAEHAEANLPRGDAGVYVCPFLGYLARDHRLGCLIHPDRTGVSQSQQASFYGQSICQGYNCATKDSGASGEFYSRALERLFGFGDDYGRLVGDVLFFSGLDRIGDLWLRLDSEGGDGALSRAFATLCRARLAILDQERKGAITSFEIKYRYFEDVVEELRHYVGKRDHEAELGVRVLVDSQA